MSLYVSGSELLFFILIYLLLFYDSSVLFAVRGINPARVGCRKDCNALFFIIVFLLLFFKPAQGNLTINGGKI